MMNNTFAEVLDLVKNRSKRILQTTFYCRVTTFKSAYRK